MNELVWAVVRQEDNGNRYRVGRYRTREEAERIADRFAAGCQDVKYLVEHIGHDV